MNRCILAVLLVAAPLRAQDLRPLCADRPGLDTPACTVDAGHVQIELGLADWTHDRQPDSVTDTILAGDALARIGVGAGTELRLGWTAYGHERFRDRATGAVDRAARTGDVTIGVKQNLIDPDGQHLSIALLPFATLPVGRRPIGAGTWTAGLVAPVDYQVNDTLLVQFTTEVDALANQSGHGRHAAFTGVAGLGFAVSKSVTTSVEVEATRDKDPSGHVTQLLTGLSLAYQPAKRIQLDIGFVAGLNHSSPDAELYVGVARKF